MEKWEKVAEGTSRLRVPGGWLYLFNVYTSGGVALAFVPDPRQPVHVGGPL